MSLLTTLTGTRFADLIARPSLEVYLDAIDSPIITDGSDNISQWSDLSGKGNHALQVGSDAMPVLVEKDGFPAIYSDGAAGRKLGFTHSVTNSDDFTAIGLFLGDESVSDPSTGSSLNVAFAFGGADTADNSVALRQLRTDAGELSFVAYGLGSGLDGSPYRAFESFSFTCDGADIKVHYGETLESGSGTAGGTHVFGDGRLFNENPASSSRTGIGWFHSFLLFKEALSDVQRNKIISAMKARYNIN